MFGPHALALAAQLPGLWADTAPAALYTVLCSRFDQGQAFQAVLQAWRGSSRRPQRLVFVSSAAQWPQEPPPAGGHWPPATPNLHLLDFEGGRVRLLLALGLSQPWRQLRQVQADTLWLDGQDFDSAHLPASPPRAAGAALKSLARLSAPLARLAMWRSTPEQRATLSAAGFAFEAAAGEPHTARYRPRLHGMPGGAAWPAAHPPGHAVVVGAGIAGACAAAALAQRGWHCTMLDARASPAQGASGNPAAIFHGTVHAADGTHARFTRAAALHAQRVHGALIARGVAGQVGGLLRAGADPASTLQPAGWARAWTAGELQARGSGLRADSAWFFPGGGWIDAAAAVNALLQAPGIEFRGNAHATRLQREATGWRVLDGAGRPLAEPGVVVLAGAGAGDMPTLPMGALLQQAAALPWPSTRARGQVSWFRHAGAALPWPVAGGGYALSLPPAQDLLCGATTQANDDDPLPRDEDHAFNLARVQAQTGIVPAAGTAVQGRVGWRERSPDRLPVIGAAVDAAMAGMEAMAALEGSRTPPAATGRVARIPGLFVLGAMAGRGFTWGPLAGEVLASWVDGSPWPLEADLLDALDPARFWLRQARRAAAEGRAN